MTALPLASNLTRYERPVRVYNSDLGLYGMTDVSSCLRYMDRGRVESIETLCRNAQTESWLTKYTVNVYRLDARFEQAATVGEKLNVVTDVFARSSHRAAFNHRIVSTQTGAIVGDATVETSFLDLERRLAEVPAEVIAQSSPEQAPLVPQTLRFTIRKLAPKYPIKRRFRVYFEDTDTQQIAYHVTYVRFCEWSLIELLDELGLGSSPGGWLNENRVQITGLTTRFLASAKLGDVIEVQLRVRDVFEDGRVLMEHQLVLDDEKNTVTCDVLFELTFTDTNGNPTAVPEPIEALRTA